MIITDRTTDSNLFFIKNGFEFGRGYDPTDRDRDRGYRGQPWAMDIPLIPESEWDDRARQKEKDKSRLSDIRDSCGPNGGMIPSLDQNGQGFCWAYSSAACVMLLRAIANMPYERPSPHGVACEIYGHQDRGAWGALSMEFMSKRGIPTEKYWPQKSMSREYNNEETWADAARLRVAEGYMELALQPYDRKLTKQQAVTLMLSNIPCVLDYDWWGHSVCGMDYVVGGGIRIWNSWTDAWGERGTGVVEGNRSIPAGGCAARSMAIAA